MAAEPYCPFRTRPIPVGLAKLELQQDFVVEDDVAGSLEAVALVEADGVPFPWPALLLTTFTSGRLRKYSTMRSSVAVRLLKARGDFRAAAASRRARVFAS
jgi:hypothetical protein